MDTIATQNTTEDKETPFSTYLFYGLGLGALFGGGYLLYNYMRNRNTFSSTTNTTPVIDPITSNPVVTAPRPVSTRTPSIIPRIFNPPTSRNTSTPASGFPLKQGSRGSRVIAIQQALFNLGGQAQAIIRATSMPRGKFDGRFGPGTARALRAVGFPSVLSQNDFNRLTGANKNLTSVFNPSAVARELRTAIETRNIFATRQGLKKMQNPTQYRQVSTFFQNVRILGTRVTTLVNALLSVAFKNRESEKAQIRVELRRMGLKQNGKGIWFIPSISGIGNLYGEIEEGNVAITAYPTVLRAEDGTLILPELLPNTVIGYITDQRQGIAQIFTQSGETVYAPVANLRSI